MTLELPPGQQLAAADKWPIVGERSPAADDRPWSVRVHGLVASPRAWTLPELTTLPAVERGVDIHCVTRWSKLGVPFRGVMLDSLLAASQPTDDVRFVSLVARSERRHSTSLPLSDALELGTFIAWECDGRPLAVEHGGPVRVIVPGRYFYKSLKWLAEVELLAEDRLGYWEAAAGYHNRADPWREERFIAPSLTKQQAHAVVAARNIAGRELRGLDASGLDLSGLQAAGAILRDARFERCLLVGADFRGANLSNARFREADLRSASFAQADVEGADFTAADLRGADFMGASLLGCSFGDPVANASTSSAVARIDPTTRLGNDQLEHLTPGQRALVALTWRGSFVQ